MARKTSAAKTPELQKVAFTMFAVHDATRARAFYEGVLGLSRGLASPDGTWTEYDLPGGGCLALFRHPDAKAALAPGGASIAFEVADLDALNARLHAAGVTYRGGVVHGPNCRMSNIVDSEGNAIILHQVNAQTPAVKVVGRTARAGFQAGARRTLPCARDALWALVVGAKGQRVLGGSSALTATSRGVTTFVAGSHYRRRLASGLFQVRVLPAGRGRATLALHREGLASAAERGPSLAQLRRMLERFAALVG